MIARVSAPNLASCFCLIEDVMRPKLEGDGPGPRLASAGSVSKWRPTRRWRSVHRGEQLARVTQTRRLTDFPSVRQNELRKDAGGCRQVPAGGRSSENSKVTRSAHPSVGTGRHGHGDWMETDRCSVENSDLLIPRYEGSAVRSLVSAFSRSLLSSNSSGSD